MKVLHLNTHDVLGGAARSAWRLHEGLRRVGVESRMLVRNKHSLDFDVSVVEDGVALAKLYDVLGAEWVRPKIPVDGALFSFAAAAPRLASHPRVVEADVLHMHWTAQFLNAECIREFAALGKPLFWTFHDLWAVTGGCHYPGECRQHETSCRDCPAISEDAWPWVRREHQRKLEALRDLSVNLIAPSRWIADAARQSAVAASWSSNIRVVPYGIGTDIYRVIPQSEARVVLGVPEGRLCLLFGCHSVTERRKGFMELRAALQQAGADVELLVFGGESQELPEMPVPVRSLGHLDADEKLAYAYAAADAYLCPTLQDNLPNTVIEALACGTPVIGFATGGVPEMVVHGTTGLLAPTGNVAALADLIRRFANDSALREGLRKNAAALPREGFALETQARTLQGFYEAALEHAAPGRATVTAPSAGWNVEPALAEIISHSCAMSLVQADERHEKIKKSLALERQTAKHQLQELKESERRAKELQRQCDDLSRRPWRAFRKWFSRRNGV